MSHTRTTVPPGPVRSVALYTRVSTDDQADQRTKRITASNDRVAQSIERQTQEQLRAEQRRVSGR